MTCDSCHLKCSTCVESRDKCTACADTNGNMDLIKNC